MSTIKSYISSNNYKYGICLSDNSIIESALFEHNNTIHCCIPTQTGCNMGCLHCATTYSECSFCRNLTYIELCDLVQFMKEKNRREELPKILSFSGHGEPMMNWNNIKPCIDLYENEFKEIYVTSIGYLSTMKEILNSLDNRVCFYFSIHGSSDIERSQIIPASQNVGFASIQQINEFGEKYTNHGGNIVWNYMLYNKNCSEKSLSNLISLCKSIKYPLSIRFTKYIDIKKDIDISGIDEYKFSHFYYSFMNSIPTNINVRISKLFGEDMGVACGQMRASMLEDGDLTI